MIPVTQTKRGGPDVPPEERGDCFDACLASLLEVAIEDAPCTHDTDDWWANTQETAARHGYRIVYVGPLNQPAAEVGRWVGPVYWIAGVPSLNLGTYDDGSPVMHVVVMRGTELVHDPSLGERYPLGEPPAGFLIADAMLLVPLEIRSTRPPPA